MIITYVKEPIPYIVIDKVFTPDELKIIYRELEFIQPKLLSADKTAAAVDENGIIHKQNKGVFLDELYTNRDFSDILTVNRKFYTKESKDVYSQCHPAYSSIHSITKDTTLISYYETSDYYKAHVDRSVISICTWFFKKPKNFTGGDFKFSDYNITIPVRNNMSVVFLSCYRHEVSEITLIDPSVECSGRFTMSMFATFKG
jgi:Rps23 Pro-64 3,4-dihydroxylase Tpa1-like proline 4-hydroxylase